MTNLMESLDELVARADPLREPTSQPDVAALGSLHRALRAALAETEAALTPAIHSASRRGHTYVELAALSGYGSVTTIVKIMKSAPGPRPPRGPRR